jgi:hypothetical protein
VTDSDKAELHKLIEAEIAFGFTLIQMARLAGSAEHKKQALDNASAAYDNAGRFMRPACCGRNRPCMGIQISGTAGRYRVLSR